MPGPPFQNPFNKTVSAEKKAKADMHAALKSLQSTLHFKLTKSYPYNHSEVAWVLVWSVQPSHVKSGPSLAALAALSSEERAGLRATVSELLERPKSEVWDGIVRQIVQVLT
jgi:hypothetical protein